jgi:hypothetical protein
MPESKSHTIARNRMAATDAAKFACQRARSIEGLIGQDDSLPDSCHRCRGLRQFIDMEIDHYAISRFQHVLSINQSRNAACDATWLIFEVLSSISDSTYTYFQTLICIFEVKCP